MNGEALARSGALSNVIGMAAPGEKVQLKVWRDGRLPSTSRPSSVAAEPARRWPIAGEALKGAQARPGAAPADTATSGSSRKLAERGWWWEQVAGAAERAGIEVGDVLLAINGKPVTSVEQVKRRARTASRRAWRCWCERDGNQIFVPVPLG